jgi:hypothetical protein
MSNDDSISVDNNENHPLFPFAKSPLCYTPTSDFVHSPRHRTISAADTLESAASMLNSYFSRLADTEGEYGDYITLRVIHGAIKHAIDLMTPPD